MEILIIAVLIGLIPAAIAKSKGRNFLTWWIFGALIFIVALPMALIMKREDQLVVAGMRKCPKCAEEIKAEAQICKHCNSNVTPLSDQEKKALIKEAKKANHVPGWVVLLAFGVCGLFIWNQAQQNPSSASSGSSGLFSSDFEIQVSGSPGQVFSGSYMVVTSGGKSEQKSVDGVAPESYRVSGSIVSANFQKKSEGGTLKAVIKKDGRVVADSDTSASYGVVSVATN